MDGFSTTGSSLGGHSAHTELSDGAGGSLRMPGCPAESGPGDTPSAGLHTAVDSAVCDLYEDDPPAFADNEEDCRLIRSFDMIFQLHQRSEEIRSHLEHIDRLLLKSRTVAGLVQELIAALESEFDLMAARILFRQDHPVAETIKCAAPTGTGITPPGSIERENLPPSGPFVLDDPNGDLSRSLFGEAASLLSSAVAANLSVDGNELGLLCLGSDDPNRYCGGMNTDLIASLADKIALGIQNAWDHESRGRKSLVGRVEGIYCESFFREYLAKEFHRSWRSHNVFSLMALSWTSSLTDRSFEEVAEQIRAQLRSSDVVAEDDSARVWILLPDTDVDGANAVAERLSRSMSEEFDQEVTLHFGIAAFSRQATSVHTLMNRAQAALTEAVESGTSSIVVKM
jgi:GGDEF domain-containing protein/uncharacterized protein YigA (DUF484 family)